jgi:hypothetical protein
VAGKTTLAHRSARAVGCPAICRDEIKEGMVHATPGFGAAAPGAAGRRTRSARRTPTRAPATPRGRPSGTPPSAASRSTSPPSTSTPPTNQIEAILLPAISASPSTVAPDGQVTVNGGSFGFGTVSIYLDHVSGTPLATTSGGIRGTFTVPVTIPPATTAGLHKLIAVASGNIRASAAIAVS